MNLQTLKRAQRTLALTLALTLTTSQLSCSITRGSYWVKKRYAPEEYDSENLRPNKHFAKLHLKTGEVYVLKTWTLENTPDGIRIKGQGNHYSVERSLVQSNTSLEIQTKDLLLIETTDVKTFEHTSVILIGVGVGVSVIGLMCLANPKACFGSCPTIYNGKLNLDELDQAALLAEGFSDAIAPSLESTDLDPLHLTRRDSDGRVTLTLTNEAYETHAIRSMRLKAVDLPDHPLLTQTLHVRSPNGKDSPDDIYPVSEPLPPRACQSSATGDCLRGISAPDRAPHLAPAHPTDLGHRETITIELPDPREGAGTEAQDLERGVALYLRNSLLNTFIFYQLWAWLGIRADDWIIKLERTMREQTESGGGDDAVGQEAFKRVAQALGDLAVEVKISGTGEEARWLPVGRYDEVGPLAQERVLMRLPKETPAGPITLRLTAAQSNFRLDFVGATLVGEPLKQRTLEPSSLAQLNGDPEPHLLALLQDPDRYLITNPGAHLVLTYSDELGSERSRYFLESTGHYLEWMQPGWLKEQDEEAFIRFMMDPAEGLRQLAPEYKSIEPHMEELFWNSRFRRSGSEG